MKVSVSYSENVVTADYKSRTFTTMLECEYKNEIKIEEAIDELQENAMQLTRKKVKDYIDRMKHPEKLVGGKKSQITALRKRK